MALDSTRIQSAIDRLEETDRLSGVVALYLGGQLAFGQAYGLANRADGISNTLNTRFQVASGCKIFTSTAICQLVQRGAFSFETPLRDCLDIEFPHFDPEITVHHLLTHTSGIESYFDEEGGQEYEEIWRERPMYRMTRPRDFLPLFQDGGQRFSPGSRFSYNDAAFIILGLIVEQHAQTDFIGHVEGHVLRPCNMTRSGYYRLDRLPGETALAYIEDESGEEWRTNIYSVPVVGAPDGGAFVTVPDMTKFWLCLYSHRLLSGTMTETMLRAHVEVPDQQSPTHYGYGVWMTRCGRGSPIHYVEGWDPGVAFLSASYPEKDLVVTIARNSNRSVWRVFNEIAPILDAI